MLKRYFAPRKEDAFTFLRVVTGFSFAFHGLQKIFGFQFPADKLPEIWSQGWFGGIIELVTGLAMAAGAFTAWAAFLASGTMAVAYVQFHWKLDFGVRFFPPVNKGELALVYSALFLYFACRGAGKWSVDSLLTGRKSR